MVDFGETDRIYQQIDGRFVPFDQDEEYTSNLREEELPERFQHLLAQQNQLQHRDCTHGGPPPQSAVFQNILMPRIIQCFDVVTAADGQILSQHGADLMPVERLTSERTLARIHALTEYWMPYSKDIDDSYARLCFSLATDATLDGNLDYGRLFLQVGIFLMGAAAVGVKSFVAAQDETDESSSGSEQQATSAACVRIQSYLNKTRSDRGMIMFLNKQVRRSSSLSMASSPCDCLHDLAQAVRARPSAGKCNYCKRQDDKIKLKKCSGCHVNEYCSRECQVTDWKVHKNECQSLKNAGGNARTG